MAYGQNMNAPMSGLMSLAAMKGRRGDNTLVHVNPMELKALDAMSPGGLTRNPSTGLPEAFKLKDILPILGGIVAPYAIPMMLGGGAALTGLAGAAASGLGAATGTALGGGNREEILGSGLITGLTAGMFGGKEAASAVGKEAVEKAGTEAALKTASEKASGTFAQKIGERFADPTIISEAAGKAGMTNLAAVPIAQQAVGKQLIGQTVGAGIGALTSSPAMYAVPQIPTYTPPGIATATEATPAMTPQQQQAEVDRYIRQGGAVPQFFNYSPAQLTTGVAEGGSPAEAPVVEGKMFSGMVEDNGTGDGMSDNVEFEVVGDPEIGRAMLSPDEYVMDAYTVAALGNGSADAGADKLDKFREELRQKVYGSKEQPNEIDGAKELSKLT